MSLTSTLTSLAAVASSVCALLAWGSYKPEMMITFLVAITSIELLSRSVSTVGNLRQEVSTLNREIESLQATTVRAKERARRHQTFDLAKSQFLAFSCHDLRKPLLELRDGLAH